MLPSVEDETVQFDDVEVFIVTTEWGRRVRVYPVVMRVLYRCHGKQKAAMDDD